MPSMNTSGRHRRWPSHADASTDSRPSVPPLSMSMSVKSAAQPTGWTEAARAPAGRDRCGADHSGRGGSCTGGASGSGPDGGGGAGGGAPGSGIGMCKRADDRCPASPKALDSEASMEPPDHLRLVLQRAQGVLRSVARAGFVEDHPGKAAVATGPFHGSGCRAGPCASGASGRDGAAGFNLGGAQAAGQCQMVAGRVVAVCGVDMAESLQVMGTARVGNRRARLGQMPHAGRMPARRGSARGGLNRWALPAPLQALSAPVRPQLGLVTGLRPAATGRWQPAPSRRADSGAWHGLAGKRLCGGGVGLDGAASRAGGHGCAARRAAPSAPPAAWPDDPLQPAPALVARAGGLDDGCRRQLPQQQTRAPNQCRQQACPLPGRCIVLP